MGPIKKTKSSAKAVKAVPKIATVSAIAAGKAVPPKRAVTKAPKAAAAAVSPEERLKMVEQSAYFRAEKAGFTGDSHAHWLAAEAEVDALLKSQGRKVAKAKK
ncbi:MAG: hypothetical protein BWY59_00318 [Verrucomicrobia bacterium ADurb.Bin345]|nr:MAG: hypothetical protein BWY59_00318 [Verrucomicrobia bacterium ADurb.Bin345]